MRTTITIDLPLFKKIRQISHREHMTFTRLVHDLLTLGLNKWGKHQAGPSPFRRWHSKEMGALIDYSDKEALYRALDQRQ